MDAKIGADVLTVSAKANEAKVVVSSNIPSHVAMTTNSAYCPSLSIISINGHSLSSINPDFSNKEFEAMPIAA